MASFFDPSQPFDPNTFNYGTQADIVKRKRDMAAQLMQAKMPQGQMVPGGPNGFYVAPSKGSSIAAALQTIVGGYMSGKADDAQKELDANSQAALAAQLQGLNKGTNEQVTTEGPLQGNPSGGADAVQPPDVEGPVTGNPTSAPVQSITPAAKQAAVKFIGNPGTRVGTEKGRSTNLGSNTPSSLALAKASMTDMPPLTGLPPQPPSMKDLAAAQLQGGSMNTGALTNPAVPTPPVAQGPGPMPAMPQGPGPMPQGPAPQQMGPGAPVTPPAMPAAPSEQMGPGAPVETTVQKPPSTEQMIARLSQLAQTGPAGAQIANAQMNQMFASKNGRFETKVLADPVNGGFVQVTTDTQTGQTMQPKTIGASGATVITGQRVGDNGEVLNVHKNGTTSPMLGPDGKPVHDGETGRKNDEFVTTLAGKKADAQSKLASLDKISSDLSLAGGLAAQQAGKYAGIQASFSQYFGGGEQRQALERILNDTRLIGIMQDKENSGTAGAGLMRAYQEHGLNASMRPEALMQGLTQMKSVIDGQRTAVGAEIGVHHDLLQKYSPRTQTPAQSAGQGGRAPGNYTF